MSDLEKRLYVGNIPFAATEGDIVEFFRELGHEVSDPEIIRGFRGLSRGYGFVTAARGDAAVAEVNGRAMVHAGKARNIVVRESRPNAKLAHDPRHHSNRAGSPGPSGSERVRDWDGAPPKPAASRAKRGPRKKKASADKPPVP